MNCIEFRRHYSDYRDGLIEDAGLSRAIAQHLADCLPCTQYDRLISFGVDALRAGGIEPSPGFGQRLRWRMARAASVPEVPVSARVTAALVLIAGLALFLVEVTERPATNGNAHVTPLAVANPGVPFVSFTTTQDDSQRTGSGADRVAKRTSFAR